MAEKSINLFQPNSSASSINQSSLVKIEKLSYVLLAAVIVLGFIVGIVLIFLQIRVKSLQGKKDSFSSTISESIVKEGMLMDMKKRLSVIDTIIKNQKSPIPYIDTMQLLTGGKDLSSFSLGEGNAVNVSFKFPSVSAAVPTFENIMNLTSEKKIRNPILVSLSIDKDTGVSVTISYLVPVSAL